MRRQPDGFAIRNGRDGIFFKKKKNVLNFQESCQNMKEFLKSDGYPRSLKGHRKISVSSLNLPTTVSQAEERRHNLEFFKVLY